MREPAGKLLGYANYNQRRVRSRRGTRTCLWPPHSTRYAITESDPTPIPTAFAVDAIAWAICVWIGGFVDKVVRKCRSECRPICEGSSAVHTVGFTQAGYKGYARLRSLAMQDCNAKYLPALVIHCKKIKGLSTATNFVLAFRFTLYCNVILGRYLTRLRHVLVQG